MKSQGPILVVEDDHGVRDQLAQAFRTEGYEVVLCASGKECFRYLDDKTEVPSCSLAITDLRLPDVNGLEIVERVKARCPECPVLVITAYASVDTAVQAMRRGAFHYLAKPFSVDCLFAEVEAALEHARLQREERQLRQRLSAEQGLGRIVGRSPAIEAMRTAIREVAPTNARVLITGQTGTGKELVANALHYESRRAGAPLVKVNCAALSETLLESELFGHEKGAFTGAEQARTGRFERADAGTLFLDEISEMGPHLQAKLLRVLQGEAFERVGGDRALRPDVRVIAATNRDPEEAISSGKLRQDLYYRLNAFRIEVPSLKSRREDIPLLADHFVNVHASRTGKRVNTISEDALGALCAHDWPGNVRELEHCIERAVIVTREEIVQKPDLPATVSGLDSCGTVDTLNLQDIEKATVLRALRETDGNKVQAAALLGIYPSSLYKKMRRFDIPLETR